MSKPSTARRTVQHYTRSDLLALPHRKWDDTSPRYDSLLILPTGRKHESGWGRITIIGCRDQCPVEICTTCSDDVELNLPTPRTVGTGYKFTIGEARMDCAPKSSALRLWGRGITFSVSAAISSITVSACRGTRGGDGSGLLESKGE